MTKEERCERLLRKYQDADEIKIVCVDGKWYAIGKGWSVPCNSKEEALKVKGEIN